MNVRGIINKIVKASTIEYKRPIMSGKLIVTEENGGFASLAVPQEFSDNIYEVIYDESKRMQKPEYGAHISVMSGEEINKVGPIKENGGMFEYEIGSIHSVNPDDWDEMSQVWFVKCYSKELERLRESYNLTPKYKGHEFHITIAVQPQIDSKENKIAKKIVDAYLSDIHVWM